MDALRHLCSVRDRQLLAMRSMALRRRQTVVRYEQFIPPLTFLANFCIAAYFERTMLDSQESFAAFFLVESCFAVVVLFVHGGAFLDGILGRSRILGVSSGKRFAFMVLEFAAHPMVLAQGGSLLLVWVVALHAMIPALAVAVLATGIWYIAIVTCSAVVFLTTNRHRIRPAIVGAILGTILFVLITGPTVLTGVSPYASIPVSGWAGCACSAAVSGNPQLGLLWLLPSLGISLLLVPIGMKKG